MIAAAYNAWLAATWLAADDRYRASLVVGVQDPVAAGREIRRAAEESASWPCCCPSPTPVKGSSARRRRSQAVPRSITSSGTPA
jgi:hypothetical protein